MAAVRQPWLHAGLRSAAAASWTAWTEQPGSSSPAAAAPATGINNQCYTGSIFFISLEKKC